MRFALLLFLAAADATGGAGIPLATSTAGDGLIVDGVYLNGTGPFRMLVDTGNATSIVRPEVARRLGLKPRYLVEQDSVAGTRRAPAAILDEVRAGGATDRWVEAIIGDVCQRGVDGVLGQSWLVRHDYLLDYRNRRLMLDGAASATGIRVPLRSADGRPVVVAAIDGRLQEMVVDSGAPAVVLYEKPGAGGGVATELFANGGRTRALRGTVRLSLADEPGRAVEAVRVDVNGLGPGLLPAAAFASVFVSNREGFVEFGR